MAWGYAMAHELMSPYCPGRTLSQCPSPQAGELRQWIIMQAAAGSTRAEVEAILLERFGDRILQAPKAEGWGVSAYAIPMAFFVLGGGLVVFLLRRLVRAPESLSETGVDADAARSALDPELERLLDAELAED